MARPVLEVADIFRDHGPAWRKANAGHVSLGQLKVMSAIESCRTAALGGHVMRCEDCSHTAIAYNSCRNRHCPKCQGSQALAWMEERKSELLAVPYFHVVFTLPVRIAAIAYHNKAVTYDLLFKASSQTMRTIAADPKRLGVKIGFTSVLHTWGSAMAHHPHVHMIVPGGGISLDGTRWIGCRPNYLLPVKVLSRLFRPLMLEMLVAARGNRRDQAHAMARTCGFDDGGFAPLAPRAPGMMIGAHVSGVAKEDLGLFSLRQGFDLRVVLLEPLLDHSLVALLRTMQGLLASDAKLRQQPTNRIGAQHDPKLILDQLCHHGTRPQREGELQLQRVLLRDGVVNPLQGARIQFGRPAQKRLGFQRSPATSPILRQPAIYRTAVDPHRSCDNLGAFASLYAAHGAGAHLFQRRVIQLASIVLSHLPSESDEIRPVNKNVQLLVDGLITLSETLSDCLCIDRDRVGALDHGRG